MLLLQKKITKKHDLSKPQGVRRKIVDIEQARAKLDWRPQASLEEGMEKTYKWIEKQVKKK